MFGGKVCGNDVVRLLQLLEERGSNHIWVIYEEIGGVEMAIIADRIEVNPEICHGKPVIAGTRVPAYMILGLLAEGLTPEEIIEDYYNHITKEDILACLKYAQSLIEEEEVVGTP